MLNTVITRTMQRFGLKASPFEAHQQSAQSVWTPPRAVPDPDFILRGNPRHPGHDEYGYRNPSGQTESDICVLGGSFAYGAGVGFEQSWPRLLDWIGAKRVSNAAFCGWGPVQAAISMEKELHRSPSQILLTLHVSDARRAFLAAARSRHQLARSMWQPQYDHVEVPSLFIKDMAAKAYRLEHQANPDASPGELLATIAERGVPDFNRYEIGGSRFYLADNACRAAQAHGTPTVEAGHRILTHCIEHIARMAKQAGTRLLVLLAPSREYVAYTRMHEAEVRSPATLRALGTTEQKTLDRLKSACDNAHTEYLDLTDSLASALPRRIFPQDSRDANLSPKGCRLIAETVHYALS